ncbi:MAG TPA: type II toxin-antitoxin system prevent-host-death family antitoxin [Microbacterium sp.]|jgi:prevent-host-death family protein|nr:type II toxin-antitoxin system prevent-host-death family antitoxin [Microbacterium sp.]
MGRVTKTELNQQTARVLARVAKGERITVTERGAPIAEISPPAPSRWDELIAAGKVRPATESGPLPFDPVKSEVTVQEMIDDIRADRS